MDYSAVVSAGNSDRRVPSSRDENIHRRKSGFGQEPQFSVVGSAVQRTNVSAVRAHRDLHPSVMHQFDVLKENSARPRRAVVAHPIGHGWALIRRDLAQLAPGTDDLLITAGTLNLEKLSTLGRHQHTRIAGIYPETRNGYDSSVLQHLDEFLIDQLILDGVRQNVSSSTDGGLCRLEFLRMNSHADPVLVTFLNRCLKDGNVAAKRKCRVIDEADLHYIDAARDLLTDERPYLLWSLDLDVERIFRRPSVKLSERNISHKRTGYGYPRGRRECRGLVPYHQVFTRPGKREYGCKGPRKNNFAVLRVALTHLLGR